MWIYINEDEILFNCHLYISYYRQMTIKINIKIYFQCIYLSHSNTF